MRSFSKKYSIGLAIVGLTLVMGGFQNCAGTATTQTMGSQSNGQAYEGRPFGPGSSLVDPLGKATKESETEQWGYQYINTAPTVSGHQVKNVNVSRSIQHLKSESGQSFSVVQSRAFVESENCRSSGLIPDNLFEAIDDAVKSAQLITASRSVGGPLEQITDHNGVEFSLVNRGIAGAEQYSKNPAPIRKALSDIYAEVIDLYGCTPQALPTTKSK